MEQENITVKKSMDGDDLRRVFTVSTRVLERNAETINALNVFPVPDGDTGTNMLLTMLAITEEMSRTDSTSAGRVAAAMARGGLLGARGNSGVILSQFFKGLAQGVEGRDRFSGTEFASALEKAKECAYKAVSKPVEGTILTVIKEAAQAAQKQAADDGSVVEVLQAACDAARDAVAHTPTLLPVLREAGVVDAGGQGLMVILEGALRCLRGEGTDAIEVETPQPVGIGEVTSAVSEGFLTATEEELYGYCTQFLIQGEDLDVDAIREQMGSMGRSAVVIGEATMVKVHVHTDDPGAFLSFAVSRGTLAQVKIDNIDEQHQEFLAARRGEAQTLPMAVVAVTAGDGLNALFRSLGAAATVSGGDTMNPSIQDLLDAVEKVPSKSVVMLPNNRNIVPAAQQACQLAQKDLKVVPTRSIPQGIAAILAFNPELDPKANLSAMERAYASVRTGEITTAVRSASVGGISVAEGQIMGLLEHQLVTVGASPTQVLLDLLGKANTAQGELVTLYWGHDLTQEDSQRAAQEVLATFPGVEVEVVRGGQPHYHYIVSIE